MGRGSLSNPTTSRDLGHKTQAEIAEVTGSSLQRISQILAPIKRKLESIENTSNSSTSTVSYTHLTLPTKA